MAKTGTVPEDVHIQGHSQEALDAAVKIAELSAKLGASELRSADLQKQLGKSDEQLREAMDLLRAMIERDEKQVEQPRGFWAWLTRG